MRKLWGCVSAPARNIKMTITTNKDTDASIQRRDKVAKFDLDYFEEIKRAKAGDLNSMFNVASYIIWGDQMSPLEPEAVELAVRYYKANAENGDTDSMLDLGAMYLEGRGVGKDEKEALRWYEIAASLNGPRACRCIANYYRYDILDNGTPIPTADSDRLQLYIFSLSGV